MHSTPRRTGTKKVPTSTDGCSTCYRRDVWSRLHSRPKQSRDGNATLGEYEKRFRKALDEDVNIGVILTLAPSQVQNYCHLNSYTLRRYVQVRAMLFDCCRAQCNLASGGVVPMDLSMLGKIKGKKGKGDRNVKDQGKGKGGESDKGEKGKDEDRNGKGIGKANAKTTKYFDVYLFIAKRTDT